MLFSLNDHAQDPQDAVVVLKLLLRKHITKQLIGENLIFYFRYFF